MMRKAIIPAAGLGTRLLPATKEQPKEMLPVFTISSNGQLCVKPFLQLIFEKLFDAGFRDFCFIVGRGKRSIEDHFTLDNEFIERLKTNNKFALADELYLFYEKLRNSNLYFINQPEPRGFGDAVYCARAFTDGEAFLVHAGDDLIISKNNGHLRKLMNLFEKRSADAALFVERVEDPTKYGVVIGKKIGRNLYQVQELEEKPSSPSSNIATVAIYAFNSKIYQAIEKTPPGKNNEIQLTDAIQRLIDENSNVYAIELEPDERRIGVGDPKSYWAASQYCISHDSSNEPRPNYPKLI